MKVETNQRTGFDPIKMIIEIETQEELEALYETLNHRGDGITTEGKESIQLIIEELRKY